MTPSEISATVERYAPAMGWRFGQARVSRPWNTIGQTRLSARMICANVNSATGTPLACQLLVTVIPRRHMASVANPRMVPAP
jgi:hypothetical protein